MEKVWWVFEVRGSVSDYICIFRFFYFFGFDFFWVF